MAVHSLGVVETQRHQWLDQEGELGGATEKEWGGGGEGPYQATGGKARPLMPQRGPWWSRE